MQYNFTNGTKTQKALWQEAVGYLLNLPLDSIPLTIGVEFVKEAKGQTNFAVTSTTQGSRTATTQVRKDAPGFGDLDAGLIQEAERWGLVYDATKHFHETAVHELGHAAFAALPHAKRLAVCALFGVHTDDDSVINDQDLAWEDRVTEGIAETFKEAFLPNRYRVFPNRSNQRIPYSKYPEFRRLFREGLAEEGEGELTDTILLEISQIAVIVEGGIS